MFLSFYDPAQFGKGVDYRLGNVPGSAFLQPQGQIRPCAAGIGLLNPIVQYQQQIAGTLVGKGVGGQGMVG